MKNLSVSTTNECRTGLEILRYTQDDKENGNNKSVILNEVKNLSVSTTNECRTGLEILRYTQDDKESGRLPRLTPRNDGIEIATANASQ